MPDLNTQIGSAAGTGTTIALTQLTALSAASATGIGAAVTAGIALFEAWKNEAHFKANDIVQKLENPFHTLLAQIIDVKDRAVGSGTATVEQLAVAHDAVIGLWVRYQQEAAAYAQQGTTYRLVAQQSVDNLNGPQGVILKVPANERYGANGFIDALVFKINAEILALQTGYGTIGAGSPVTLSAGSGGALITVAGQKIAVSKSNWYIFALAGLVLIIIIRRFL